MGEGKREMAGVQEPSGGKGGNLAGPQEPSERRDSRFESLLSDGGVRPIEKESPLVPEKQKNLLFRDQRTLFFYPAHCLAMFANFVYSGLQTRLIVPIGPFLCFAIITSAILGISVSLL